MKKWMSMMLAMILLLSAGCSVKVRRDTFSIPQEMVKSVEIQREYLDESGNSYFYKKVVTSEEDMEKICSMIRTLPVEKASQDEPHPITDFSIIVLLRGEKDHRLILNEDMAFYYRVAYNYQDAKTFQQFKDLYDNLGYEEEKTEPSRF